jgi:hypothetical protein
MLQWVNHDKTLICLVAPDVTRVNDKYSAQFYDSDLGFTTAIAYRPMTEEEGRMRFGHLRLA